MLAAWRVSLHRTRADWPIVGAAALITLLAAVLLAAGAIYPSAAAEAGLRRALAEAPAGAIGIELSAYDAPAAAEAFDGHAQTALQPIIAPTGGTIVRDWRGSATLALPALPAGRDSDQATLGYLDALPEHATLVDGAWPADGGATGGGIEVVVVKAAAETLGLHVGDDLVLVADRSTAPVVVPVRLVGIFSITDASAPYWGADAQLLAGIRENSQYRTFGPFLTTHDSLVSRADIAQLYLRWRVYPDFDRLAVDDIAQLRRSLETVKEQMLVATGKDFVVGSGLPSILGGVERSLLVSRTGVLLLMAQLALLAAYAVALTATLLVDHRRVETALLRSRGAGLVQVAVLALVEGVLIAVPAVIVAPWLAVAVLEVLNVVGPLADAGLAIQPRVTADAYLAAGAAGLVCVALLVLPAALAARGFAAEQGATSRQETRTFGQRMGLDVALLALTGIALWQLRLYGAPLTRTVQGNLGLDPLLVAAPTIGLAAGGVLALRVLPLLAQAVERLVTRSRDLVATLGARQLARRPLRYTRSGLLLMLSMSMGVFAISYAATWSESQRDQAAYQAGADVRVQASSALPGWALPEAYAGIAGVQAVTPVERINGGVSFAASTSTNLLALDARTAAGTVLFRGDEANVPIDELFRSLLDGRPKPPLVTLPDGAAYLRFTPNVEITAVDHLFWDDETGEVTVTPMDPAELEFVEVTIRATVRDRQGLTYDVVADQVPMEGARPGVVVSLGPTSGEHVDGAGPAVGRLAGPLELVRLRLELWLPSFTQMTAGAIGIAAMSAGETADGPWTDVPLAAAGGWRASLRDLPTNPPQGLVVAVGGTQPEAEIFGGGYWYPATTLDLTPAAVAAWQEAVPAIANRAFAVETGSEPGDTIGASLGGREVRLSIAGIVDNFPTTDPERGLLILDEATLGFLRLFGPEPPRAADEWWMAAADGQTDAIVATLRGDPFTSATVVSASGRTRSLSTDPVALGIIGALAVGFVATGLFALVGLTVSAAVSARQRRTEFALLRALGLSGRQLADTLWLENGSLVVVSLLAGTGLGLLIGWVVLPFITVTQQATAAVPPVVIEVPWDRILLLDVVSALALGFAVIVIGAVLRRLGVGSVLRMGED